MADTVRFGGAELGLDESPVEIVTTTNGRGDVVLHTVEAWQAADYMIALAIGCCPVRALVPDWLRSRR